MGHFIVLGLQRSGTNFTESIVRGNIGGAALIGEGKFMWKHAYNVNEAKLTSKEVNMIFIHKHPFSWVNSILTNNVDIKRRYPDTVFNQELHDPRAKNGDLCVTELIKLWNNHSNFWINLLEKHKIFRIKYEDLIKSRQDTIDTIKRFAASINKKTNEPFAIPDKVSQSNTFTEEARQKYLGVKTDKLDQWQLKHVASLVDRRVLEVFDYQLPEIDK